MRKSKTKNEMTDHTLNRFISMMLNLSSERCLIFKSNRSSSNFLRYDGYISLGGLGRGGKEIGLHGIKGLSYEVCFRN